MSKWMKQRLKVDGLEKECKRNNLSSWLAWKGEKNKNGKKIGNTALKKCL